MKKYKIGYTTGVYDGFHIGDVEALKNAKAMCEHLIVGVSTDELVWDDKNKKPLIPFEDRMTIVSAIKYVDGVVPQDTLNQVAAWEKFRFNAIFYDEDWKGTPLYEEYRKQFDMRGVDLIFMPQTQGSSPTQVSEKVEIRD